MIKRSLLSVLLISCMLFSFATEISIDKAKTVASAFFFEQAIKSGQAISLNEIQFNEVVTRENENGEDALYLLSVDPQGWVIVSADDIIRPILAYNLQGTLSYSNDVFESWIGSYINQLDYAKEINFTGSEEISNQWSHFNTTNEANLNSFMKMATIVEPLVSCNWNQDYPYNMLCPEDSDGDGGHVFAGCVATAMSMIMYYYKYPEMGTGSNSYYYPDYGTISANFGETTYMWDAMMDETGSSEHTRYAIAEIQSHCGVAVNMMYGADGSGAYSFNVPNAIESHFGYSSESEHLSKDSGYTWSNWYEMIREQLDQEFPVYYSGSVPEGGHAFVCDGYDDADMFHFNFGWSGYDNGFFTLTGANALDYNQGQAIVRNFYPNQEDYPYYCSGDNELPYYSGSFEDGSGPCEAYAANSDCSWLLGAPSAQDSVSSYKLYFKDFDIAAGDMLTVYSGATADSPIVGQYSQDEAPADLTVDNDQVFVTFTSSSTAVDNEGFRIQYNAIRPNFCNGLTYLTEPTGTLNDGSGDKNYVPNTMCQFIISPANATSITLSFTEFEMDSEGDVLTVYQTNPTSLLGEFTGDNLPEALTSASGGMHIMFQTDNTGSAAGFTAQYEIGNIGVEDNSNITSLNVYPNPAENILNISFENLKDENTTISLVDITGKKVYMNEINNNSGVYFHQIDVAEFGKGIYFLEIRTKEGSKRSKVIIR